MTEWDYTHSNINLKINQNKMTAVIAFTIYDGSKHIYNINL